MHPILFRIPLPQWTLPLMPVLFGLAAVGVLLALFGWRKQAPDLLVIGGVLAVGGVVGGLGLRGDSYTLGELPIYSYGAMLCLSFVVGWYLTLGLATKDGLPREIMANTFFVAAVSALVFARVLYVLTNLDEFGSFADLLDFRRGGLVAYGGFLGGFLGSWAYLRSHRLRLLPWADVAVPSLATGLIITRIGCYMFGCDFGKPLADDAPGWLRRLGTFPHWTPDMMPDGSGSPAWVQHVNQRGLSADAEASLAVHPTQLYESLVGVLLLILVFAVRRHQRFRGQVFLAFTFGYGALRFLLEILRDDLERGEWGPHVPRHLYIPLALLGFAAAYALGPAQSIRREHLRRATELFAVVPAVVAYFAMKPAAFAANAPIQLTTSQWIGLLSAVAAAFAWGVWGKRAEVAPAQAMSLGLDDEEEEAPEEREEPEDGSEAQGASDEDRPPAAGKKPGHEKRNTPRTGRDDRTSDPGAQRGDEEPEPA